MKRFFNILLVIFLVCVYSNIDAQVSFQINVDVYNGSTKGAMVLLSSSSGLVQKQAVRTSGKNKFNVKFNDLYTIKIEKKGYVTKLIEINSDVPQSVIDDDTKFNRKKIDVKLFPKKGSIDLSLFERPVIKYAYDRDMDDFVRDRDYEEAIASNINSIEKRLRVVDKKPKTLAVNKNIPVAPKPIIKPKVVKPASKKVNPPVREKKIKKKIVKPVVKKKVEPKKQKRIVPKAPIRSSYKEMIADNSKSIIYPYPVKVVDLPLVEREKYLTSIQRGMIDKDFNSYLSKANKSLEEKKYLLAEFYFLKASKLKRLDEESQELFDGIGNLVRLTEAKRLSIRVKPLVKKAEYYYQKESLIYSRYYYNLAKELDPKNASVNERLEEINTRFNK